jgi:hypothetical protein
MSARLLLRGIDHPLFGAVTAVGTVDGRSGVAIAAGGDPSKTRWETKGDAAVPNEDAVCIVDAGDRVLLAVADSHFGHRASHAAIELLAGLDELPGDPAALAGLVARIARLPRVDGDESETTLAIALLERRSGTGFGLCFGDSTIATVASDGVDVWSAPGEDFVAPGDAESFAGAGRGFRLVVPDGAFLVGYTDGVDGCARDRGLSIGGAELRELRTRSGPEAADFARRLAELALCGVHGHEGGLDNVAVAAVGR